jgi:hypothetical protein
MARTTKPAAERVRDMTPTLVRMNADLRAALVKAAAINGRSLNMEVVTRLRDSVAGDRRAPGTSLRAEEAPPDAASQALSEAQRMLLQRFSRLTPDKQLALMQLLAP